MSYELKTKQNTTNIIKFLENIDGEQKRKESFELLEIFRELTGEVGTMWGESIIGFGSYHYTYASGQEGEWMRTGFSPRKSSLSIYIMPGYNFDTMTKYMDKLGKYKAGKSCLNIKKLSDIDIEVLKKIIQKGLDIMEELYPQK